MTSASGNRVRDSDGHDFLDMMVGLWCVNIGYGRTELADAAYNQMKQLSYYSSFRHTTTLPTIELSNVLADITPEGIDYIFFGSSGSESNDTMVRLVRLYWELKKQPSRKIFISRTAAYHGSTLVGASLSGSKAMHAQGGLPLPGFVHVMPPFQYEFGAEMTEAAFGQYAVDEIEKKIVELGAENIAAFVGEPIQGAGGVIVPPENYWRLLQELCHQYDILLCIDEVICGFGRLGKWFGSDYYDIKPDVMTIAKGITSGYFPLSCVGIGNKVSQVLTTQDEILTHGYTHSGHPVACAVALENIRLLKEEGILEKVEQTLGPYFQKRMRELSAHPLVGEVRGAGLMSAIQLVKNKDTRECFDPKGRAGALCPAYCMQNKVIVRTADDTIICAPPLTITHEEIDLCVECLLKSLDATRNALI